MSLALFREVAMRSVAEAQQIVLEHTPVGRLETVALDPTALGRFLAEDVLCDIDSPPFDKATMDGYAVRVQDVSVLPVELKVVAEIAAGKLTERTLGQGECCRIFTGAPIPSGCDAVIRQEEAEVVSDGTVRFRHPVRPEQFIVRRGREMTKGQAILHLGDRVGPETFGILSSIGKNSFVSRPLPSVGIVATGNELVEVKSPLEPGQIRNSNGPMLSGLVARAGGEPSDRGIVPDDLTVLEASLRVALSEFDFLLIAGGVSEGKYDLVPTILKELGVIERFHKVAIKPGKPIFFGTMKNKLVFGLPGNPVSAFVCFEMFVRPAIRKWLGNPSPLPVVTAIPLATDFATDNDRPTYSPARIDFHADGPRVRPLSWKGSSDLTGVKGINALLPLPPGKLAFPAGHRIETIPLDAD